MHGSVLNAECQQDKGRLHSNLMEPSAKGSLVQDIANPRLVVDTP